ncbi:MAG: hypothetical protein ACTSWN_02295 [Promethearchaeota archaeon]
MRIKPRKKSLLSMQKIGTVFVITIPFMILGMIAQVAVNMFNEIPRFGVSDDIRPDPSTFQDADYELLDMMATYYEKQFENYHIPLNFTVGARFTDTNYDSVSYYYFSDNGALWTGTSLVAFVGKYLAGIRENNETLKNDALRVIDRLVYGMSMMLKVPNGGLGPEYGATVARSFASPEHNLTIPGVQYLFGMDNDKMCNGSGPYSNWRWSDYTSNDEYGGYYMGVAIAFKFVNGSSDIEKRIQATLSLMIDQLCAGMLRANFLGISGHGGPTGVDQKMRFFGGASWMLLVLKMGALAFPEKYEKIYQYYVRNNLQGIFGGKESGTQEIVSNYYAYNFGIDVEFGLLMLEEDPILRSRYLENFYKSLWYCVQYHRNPYFNSIYLVASRLEPGENATWERDVEDQLMEFYPHHFPDVYNRTALAPVPDDYEVVNFSEYKDFLDNKSSIGALISPVFMEFNFEREFYNKPKTVKMSETSIFMWDRNPFSVDSWIPHDVYHEEPGISFLAPYWIMRGFGGYFNASGAARNE